MTITEKSFILVQGNTGMFLVDGDLEDALRREMRPILWHRAGLFCVVPVEVLKNTLDQIDMYKQHPSMMRDVRVDWKQCWLIPDGRPMNALSDLKH